MLSAPLFAQIRLLVNSLSKKNFKSNVAELKQLLDLYGEDAQVHLIFSLVEATSDLRETAESHPSLLLLAHEVVQASLKPNFVTLLVQALESHTSAGEINQDFIKAFSGKLKLGIDHQLALSFGLVQSPTAVIAQEGYKFLRSKVQDLVSSTGTNQQLESEVLHALLFVLRSNEEYISNPKATSTLIKMLKASHPETSASLSLLPLMDEENSDSADYRLGDPSANMTSTLLEREASNIVNQIRRSSDIADFIRDMGYGSAATVEKFREAVKESGVAVDERQVALLLCLVASAQADFGNEMSATVCSDLLPRGTDGDPTDRSGSNSEGGGISNWNLDVMARVLSGYASLDWQRVALELDQPRLFVADQQALKNILTLYQGASGRNFPLGVLFRPWNNKVGQLSFIHQAIAAPAEVITFQGSGRMQEPFDENPDIPVGPPNRAWFSIDLIATLLSFSETSLWYSARTLFDIPLRFCPELLICGLVCVDNTWSKLRSELLALLGPVYFRPGRSPHAVAVIKRIQKSNPQLLVEAFAEAFRQDESVAVVRDTLAVMLLVPTTQQDILNSSCVEFVVALAAAAADKEQLNLEKFMTEKLRAAAAPQKVALARGTLSFIHKHASTAKPRSTIQEQPVLLSVESLVAFLKVLQADVSLMQTPVGAEVKQALELYSKRFPEVGGSSSSDVIEEMANAYFQKIYTSEQSISEVIEMLKRFKTSKETREQEIFSCMIRNLFDEYRFFHKYPEKELRITGILFGALIQHQLVSSLTLGVALRYVLEALRRPPAGNGNTGKWFRFGMFALEQFKGRLHEWPQYCSHIVQIPHLRQNHPELVAEIERAMTRQPEQLLLPGDVAQVQGSGSTLNISGQPPGGLQLQQSSMSLSPLASGPLGNIQAQGQVMRNNNSMPPQYMLDPSNMLNARQEASPSVMEQMQLHQSLQQSPPTQQLSPSLTGMLSSDGRHQTLGTSPAGSLGLGLGGTSGDSHAKSLLGSFDQSRGGPDGNNPLLSQQRNPIGPTGMQSNQSLPPNLSPAMNQPPTGGNPLMSPPHPSVAGLLPVMVPSMIEINLPACIDKIMSGVAESTKQTQPPELVIDRIYFVINNVSGANLDSKAGELREVLKEEYHPWLANYLVQKRISSHANLHGMYMAFIDKLEAPSLTRSVLQHVLQYVSKLLRSHKIISNTGDRSVLKNLGSFLGQMTIARNKPLLQRQLDLKELLYHGYETGRLFALTPFVAKILECAEKSKVFRPPNPWLMGLMGVLAELYQVEDLKINIKFEIDLLCKRLDLKIGDVVSSETLRLRIQPKKEKNPDFNVKVGAPMMSPPQLGAAGLDVVPLEDMGATADGVIGGDQASLAQAVGEGFQEQTVIPNLAAYVIINPQLSVFSQSPQLRRVVPVAVDRAIREIIQPVVERSVTIACITTKELIVKDFAMEPDEKKMAKAAHLMVSSLAGSLALVTCKEPLRVSIGNHLRNLLTQAGIEPSVSDQVVQVCSSENLELGCMLIEKAATEKAMRDIDEALSPALQHRRKHREQTGQPFYDMSIFAATNNRFPSALPDPLRPKPGGLVQSQLEVYDAFHRPARAAVGARAPDGSPGGVDKKAGILTDGTNISIQQGLEALDALISRLDQALQNLIIAATGRDISLSMLGVDHEVPSAMREILLLPQKLQSPSREDVALRASQAIFKMLYDGTGSTGTGSALTSAEVIRLEALVAVLEGLNVKKQDLLTWIGYVPVNDANHQLHRMVLLLLLRAKLLKTSEIDLYLAKNMDAGRNALWIEFSIHLAREIIVEHLAPYQELVQTLDIIQKSAPRQQPAVRKEIQRLVDEIRQQLLAKEAAEAQKKQQQVAQQQQHQPINQVPQGLSPAQQAMKGLPRASPAQRQDRQDVTCLLEHWIVLWNESPGSEKAYLKYFTMLQQYEVTKSPDQIEKFIRIATDVCVEACLKNAVVNDNDDLHRTTLSYTIVDAYAKLLFLLVKYNGDVNSRISILQRILKAVVGSLREDTHKIPLDPRPYFRLFVDLLHDFNMFDPALDLNNIQVLTAFAIAFNNLQPSLLPAFAFAWLELVSHRMFMPALLLAKGQKGWILMHRLLMDLFTFMEPFLRKAELNDPIRVLYKGTLRVLLVLLHDFPEFLCDYHVSFCDVIPPTCIQLRNLILSAFPRNMRLPDPFTPNLKVDLLPEIAQPPRIPAGYTGALLSLKQEIDSYLKTRQPVSFLLDLPKKLRANASDGQVYNTPAVNALVIYVGTQAISQFQSKTSSSMPIAHSAPMDIFQALVGSLDAEGRYLFLNAIANQLRYPNNQTHYFSCVLLFLFAEATSDTIKEQITRVLLERLIVHRPHPWGLLITFIELIKNPRYSFWQHGFTRCAIEIERVFESVARSCMGGGAGQGGGNVGEDSGSSS